MTLAVRKLVGWTMCLAVFLGLSTQVFAQSSVTLAWNANTDSSTTGYRLHYGTASRSYSNAVSAGSATSVTVSNLTPGTTYYFAVGAYGSLGVEGAYSPEIAYTVPAARPVSPDITLAPPANGGPYVAQANIPLSANVVTNGHTIGNVQFFNGATLVGQDSAPPYSMVWSNVAAGSYTITARVVYDGTSTVDSAPASVTVANAGSVVIKLKVNSSRQAILTGTGQANHTYDVQATQNFKTWSTIGTGTIAANGSFQFTDPSPATNKVRSYRLIVH